MHIPIAAELLAPASRGNCRRPIRGSASDDPTLFLPFWQAKNLINGVAFAASSGTPTTVHLTLHWDLCRRYDPDDPIGSQGRLFNRCTEWLGDHCVPVRYAWVREWGHYKGAHCHWLLHLPVRFWRRFRTFLTQAGGFYTMPGRPDVPFKMEGGRWGMWVPKMWAGALIYTLKGMSPRARLGAVPVMGTLGIDHKPSLPLQGLRAGLSRSLNSTARKKGEWQELATLQELRAVLHPMPTI